MKPSSLMVSRWDTGGCGFVFDAERKRNSRLGHEQHSERRCELRERRGGSQGPERDDSIRPTPSATRNRNVRTSAAAVDAYSRTRQ